MTTLTAAAKAELAATGVTVVKGIVDPATCARARDMIDEILGEQKEQLDADFVPNYRRVGPTTMGRKTDGLNRLGTTSNQEGKDFEKEEEAVREGLGDESRWPEPGATAPYVTSGNWTHSILHPIENEAAAEIIPPMVPLQLDLLRCKDDELRLLNQNCECQLSSRQQISLSLSERLLHSPAH